MKDMQNEKNKTKKEGETKDKCNTAKTLGNNKTNSKKKIPEYVLYVFPTRVKWKQLADGSLMVESKFGSLPKIRFACFASTMLQLQHKQRGSRSRLLRKNVRGNRTRRNGKATKG